MSAVVDPAHKVQGYGFALPFRVVQVAPSPCAVISDRLVGGR
jgi:hypothetical protein